MNSSGSNPSAERKRSYNGGYMEVGRRGEEIVMKWLADRPNVVGVNDLRDLKVMQGADIDCGVQLLDGTYPLVEIKTCTWLGERSDNMVFEVLRINHTAPPRKAVTLGWAACSPATWLLMYANSVNRIYQVTMDEFRQAAQLYTQEKRGKSFLNFVPTDAIKSTVNILVPLEYVKKMESFHTHFLSGEPPRPL